MAIKTVIDTNVLVSALSSKSSYHWLIEYLLEEKFELAAAHYLITHDSHFSILKNIPFPQINVVRIQEMEGVII